MWKLFIACVSGAVWDLVGTVLIAILTAPPLRIQYGQGGPAELDHASLGLEPNGTRNDLNPLGGIEIGNGPDSHPHGAAITDPVWSRWPGGTGSRLPRIGAQWDPQRPQPPRRH